MTLGPGKPPPKHQPPERPDLALEERKVNYDTAKLPTLKVVSVLGTLCGAVAPYSLEGTCGPFATCAEQVGHPGPHRVPATLVWDDAMKRGAEK